MIRNSFIFLKGISNRREKNLWKCGIKDWNKFKERKKIKGISNGIKSEYEKQIFNAKNALNSDDVRFFYYYLPLKEHWRLYEHYKEDAIFIDLEVSRIHSGRITCMSILDNYNIMTFIDGINMDRDKILNLLKRSKLIITFNGNTFDVPFLRKYFGTTTIDIPCWDLRQTCNRLGLSGGLKEIEKSLGISRKNQIIKKLKGGDPYELWRTYHATGDDYFLNLLIEYNQEDTINLKFIAEKTYPLLQRKLLEI